MSAPPPPPPKVLRDGKDGLQRVTGKGRWTAETERVFLQHLLDSCNIRASARAAGFSFQSAHNRRRRNPDFASRWEVALRDGLLRLEDELLNAAHARVTGLDYGGPIQEVTFACALQLLEFHTRRRFGKAWRARPDRRSPDPAAMQAAILEKIAQIRRNTAWREAQAAAVPDDPAAAI